MTQGPSRFSDWGLFHVPTWHRLGPIGRAALVGWIAWCPGGHVPGLAAPMPPTVQPAPVSPLSEACRSALPAPTRATVVMVISPRMVYSLLEWPRMRALAQAAGFQVVTWSSPDLLAGEWTQAVRTASWPSDLKDAVGEVPPACAALIKRVNHFPYSLVLAQNHLHHWPIWGVLSDEAWATSLAHRLSALSAGSVVSQEGAAP